MKTSLTGPANLWYLEAAQELLNDGFPVVARGRAIHEALHTVLTLPDPRQRVLTIPWRRANPFFQAAETVWILAGRADAKWIMQYNKQLGQFLDPEISQDFFHGAYGERLRRWGNLDQWRDTAFPGGSAIGEYDQLSAIIKQLKDDPGSRRAVAVLHNPDFDDVDTKTADRPCNIALSAQLRDGKLHLAVFNRSNDITLGLAYTNIVQFTTIQEVLASALGAGLGTYTHFSSSLHLYADDMIARRCLRYHTREFNVYDHVAPTPMLAWDNNTAGFEGLEVMARMFARLGGPPPVVPWDSPTIDWALPALWSVRCPYWRSIAQMLHAWSFLQQGNLVRAILCLQHLSARDWQIAALEFLFRWSRNREHPDHSYLLSTAKEIAANDACFAYITHDDGRDS